MKHTKHLRFVSFILGVLLFAATAVTLMGCKDNSDLDKFVAGKDFLASYDPDKPLHRGIGDTVFDLTVTDGAGKTSYWVIHTDKATVGEALESLGLLAGEEGAFGLYVKTVCDITVDPDKDRAYWAFYENDKYAAAGVDKTPIAAGTAYALRVEAT